MLNFTTISELDKSIVFPKSYKLLAQLVSVSCSAGAKCGILFITSNKLLLHVFTLCKKLHVFTFKFGGILKLLSDVDIDNISRYTSISSLLNRLDTDMASNLFGLKYDVLSLFGYKKYGKIPILT